MVFRRLKESLGYLFESPEDGSAETFNPYAEKDIFERLGLNTNDLSDFYRSVDAIMLARTYEEFTNLWSQEPGEQIQELFERRDEIKKLKIDNKEEIISKVEAKFRAIQRTEARLQLLAYIDMVQKYERQLKEEYAREGKVHEDQLYFLQALSSEVGKKARTKGERVGFEEFHGYDELVEIITRLLSMYY